MAVSDAVLFGAGAGHDGDAIGEGAGCSRRLVGHWAVGSDCWRFLIPTVSGFVSEE
jgi:hypothetical protein